MDAVEDGAGVGGVEEGGGGEEFAGGEGEEDEAGLDHVGMDLVELGGLVA